MIAVIDGRDDAIARTGGERQLSEMRSETDDAVCGRRLLTGGVARTAHRTRARYRPRRSASRRSMRRLPRNSSLPRTRSSARSRGQSNAGPGSRLAARARCRCGRRHARATATDTRAHRRMNRIGQRAILRRLVRSLIGALQLDADREIVAALAALIVRRARMPRAQMERHVLHETRRRGGSADVTRPSSPTIVAKYGCTSARQRVGEQPIDPRPAVFARRQADAVHDDQIVARCRPGRSSWFGEDTCRAWREQSGAR